MLRNIKKARGILDFRGHFVFFRQGSSFGPFRGLSVPSSVIDCQ